MYNNITVTVASLQSSALSLNVHIIPTKVNVLAYKGIVLMFSSSNIRRLELDGYLD